MKSLATQPMPTTPHLIGKFATVEKKEGCITLKSMHRERYMGPSDGNFGLSMEVLFVAKSNSFLKRSSGHCIDNSWAEFSAAKGEATKKASFKRPSVGTGGKFLVED